MTATLADASAAAAAVRRSKRHTPYAPVTAAADTAAGGQDSWYGVLLTHGGGPTMAVVPDDHPAALAYVQVMLGQLGYGISAAALSQLILALTGERPLALRNVPKKGHAQSGLWSVSVREAHALQLFRLHRRVVFVSETMYRVFPTEAEADAFMAGATRLSATGAGFGTAVYGGPNAGDLKAPKSWKVRGMSVDATRGTEPAFVTGGPAV